MTRLGALLGGFCLLASLGAAPDLSDEQVLQLAKDYLAGRSTPKQAIDIFNQKGAVERLFSDGKLSKDADWPKLRDLKLDALRQLNEKFMKMTAERGNPRAAVTRMDHMGSSGTVEDYTPGSDADLRPNQMYHGIEADMHRVARELGITDLEAWKINILGRTGFGSVDDFLKAMRNPEKYPLEGALKFLDYNHWKTNVADVLAPDGTFRSKVPMTEILPNTSPPTAMDATDYMAEMFTRATEDFHKMSQVKDFSDPEAMKSFRQLAKDLYKYAGTRAVGEACQVAGIEPTPEMLAIMERAKQVKTNPKGELGDDPEAIRAEAEKLLELTKNLLNQSIEKRAIEIAKQQAELPEKLTRENMDSFVEVSKNKLRLAQDIVRGGPEVEKMVKEQLMLQDTTGKLWEEVDALRRYTLEEMRRTMNPEKMTDAQKTIKSFLERMLEKLGRGGGTAIAEGENPNLRRLDHAKQAKRRIPALEVENRGAAKLFEASAKKLNDSYTPLIDKSPGNGKTWLQNIQEVLRDMKDTRGPKYEEALRKKFSELDIELSMERAKALLKSLLEFERSEVLIALKAQWESLSASDQTLITRGRSLMKNLLEVENGKQALEKLFAVVMIWDIAWAAYEGGWDGFLLAAGGAVEGIVEWETITLFFSTAAPLILEKGGFGALAGASIGLAELIPVYMMAQMITAIVVKGMGKAVDWMVWDPIFEDDFKRFYDFHPRSGDDVKGQGFFDVGREGYNLTPQSLFKGNEKRKGYPSPQAMLTAIRTHRTNLLGETKNVAQFGPEGMKLWRAIEDKALQDWGKDAARTMQELKEQFQTLLGSEQRSDIDELVLGARPPRSACAADIVRVGADFEKRGDGQWRARVRANILVAGVPGSDVKVKVVHTIRGTQQAQEGSLDGYFSEAEVEPERLFHMEKNEVDFDFERAGVYTDEITVTDDKGQILAQTAFELGVGYSGEITDLSVDVAQEENGPPVRDLRAAETAFIRIKDKLEGFEAMPSKSLSAWIEDAAGRRVGGTGASRTASRAANPTVLPLSVPDSLSEGEYRIKVVEQLWKIEREAIVPVRIGAPKPRWSNFACEVSSEADTPAKRLFLRGDYIYFRVRFDAKYAPAGANAQVKWTVRRPTRGALSTAPVPFPVQEGANSFTRPEPAKIGQAAETGSWGVTATVTIGGESFTAQSGFEVSDTTLLLKRMFVTYRMNLDTPAETYAPGDVVWGHVDYSLRGPSDSAQKIQIIWQLGRDGSEPQEISRATVYMTPGEQIALCSHRFPKDRAALGRYTLSVSLRAERQDPVTSAVGFEVKPTLEWSEPKLIVAAQKQATITLDDFRLGEPIAATLRMKFNVTNGRKWHYEVRTVGPSSDLRALTCNEPEKEAPKGEWAAWVTSNLPNRGADLQPGKYTVTARVFCGEDSIEAQSTFHVYEPATIHGMTVLEHKDSNFAKSKFKPGEPVGLWVDWSLQHVRRDEKATLSINLFGPGGGQSLWQQKWGPWDAKPVRDTLRTGLKLRTDQFEGNYLFEAKLEVGGFTYTREAPFRVEVLPEVHIAAPANGLRTQQRKVTVVGTIADPRVIEAKIEQNGHVQMMAVRDGKFSQELVLRPGRNFITVTAENNSGQDSASVAVDADIPAATLKVTMVWDTDHSDLDLWVTDPEGVTTNYHAKAPRPDRNLDVDNTVGKGREVYTIFKKLRGIYTVTVKYFKNKGGGPTNAWVDWTVWEATMYEQSGRQRGYLTRDAGDKEEPGSFFKFQVLVP